MAAGPRGHCSLWVEPGAFGGRAVAWRLGAERAERGEAQLSHWEWESWSCAFPQPCGLGKSAGACRTSVFASVKRDRVCLLGHLDSLSLEVRGITWGSREEWVRLSFTLSRSSPRACWNQDSSSAELPRWVAPGMPPQKNAPAQRRRVKVPATAPWGAFPEARPSQPGEAHGTP